VAYIGIPVVSTSKLSREFPVAGIISHVMMFGFFCVTRDAQDSQIAMRIVCAISIDVVDVEEFLVAIVAKLSATFLAGPTCYTTLPAANLVPVVGVFVDGRCLGRVRGLHPVKHSWVSLEEPVRPKLPHQRMARSSLQLFMKAVEMYAC
jgi:hypothetical protein